MALKQAPARARREPRTLPTMEANKSILGTGVNSVPLTTDEVTTLIDNRRRRLVLMIVDRRSEAVALGDLSVKIAAIENDISADRVDAEQRKRVYTSLYQNHLERLDEAGVIEYDDRAKVARTTDATPAVADLIRCVVSSCSDESIYSEHSKRGVFDRLFDGVLLGVFR